MRRANKLFLSQMWVEAGVSAATQELLCIGLE